MSGAQLRPYQSAGISGIRAHFQSGKRKVLLWLATGGGKTHCFSYMMTEASQRGRRSLMVVRGRKLVSQASKRLFHEQVTHGVLMAGHFNFRPQAPIQIASVDTLLARRWRPKADLIVIDEAHQAVSEGYRELLKDYPDAFIVSVTATPYSNKSLRHVADEIVHPITAQELIDQGFLVKARYYAPSSPDLQGVKVSRSTGDYVTDQLAAVMDKGAVTGNILEHWKRLAENRPTLCFAVNVEHSKHLAAQFREGGVAAEHCDADTPEPEREAIIRRLEKGEIKVISNVGILCTGVDIPAAACIIMARPTQSYCLYIQQAGRGTRIFPGKNDFLLLDHAGNVLRHGFITDEPEPNLDGKKITMGFGSRPRTCLECFAIVEAFPCIACGWKPIAAAAGDRSPLEVAGELQEIKGPSPLERYECERYCEEQIDKCLKKNRSVWRAYYDTIEKYGEPAAKLVFFRICKRNGISLVKKKKELPGDSFPFK